MRASLTPWASSICRPLVKVPSDTLLNERIMPSTVPSRPTIGASAATSLRYEIRRVSRLAWRMPSACATSRTSSSPTPWLRVANSIARCMTRATARLLRLQAATNAR